MRELERDAAAIAERRERLLDELGGLASQLLELAQTKTVRASTVAPVGDQGNDSRQRTTAQPPPAAEQR